MQDRISTILRKTTKELCTYLEKVLPQADSNWWQNLVLEKLNPSQRLHVDQRKITELVGLDLAALLRIFDENWWLIAGEKKLAKEHRHYLKELQTIRNRYSHSGNQELPKDDLYRDLDTILRFADAIEASPEFISQLKTEKEAIHKVPPIPPVPEPDKEKTIEVSKEADQPAIPLTEKVNKLLEKFKDNIILLDAVYQWADAPTRGIGRRHPPDHGLIKSNLQIRYGLDEKDAQNIYDRFRDEVVSAGIDDFDSGYLAVYETVIKYFSDENPVLKDAVLQRLKTASEQDKYIAWLYCKVKDDYRLWGSEDGPTKEYFAVLKTTFGTMTNFGKVTQILTNLGFINRLEWVGAKHSQYNYKRNRLYCFPDYLRQVAETVDDIVPLPELPDYKRFVDALLEKKLVDALIAIERFLNNDSEYKKDLPTQPYITAEHDGVYAVNWRIRDDFKKYFFDIKGKETQDIAEKIGRILKDLDEKHYPSISLKEVGEAGLEGIPAWNLSIHDPLLSEKEIHIVLAPWFTVEQLKSFVDEASSKFVVTLTTMAGIPKLKTMYRDAFYKDINESGLNLAILDFTKGKVFEETIGRPPKLYEEIIEGLKKAGFVIERGKRATTEKPFVISAVEEQRPAEKEVARVEKKKRVEEETIQPIQPTQAESGNIIIGSKEHPEQYGIIGVSDGRKVLMDLNAPHIIFVSGMMGAGKGYTIGVISEMLVGKGIPNISNVSKPATVIVLYKPKDDVPSEFWSIRQPNDEQKELDRLNSFDAKPMNPITEDQFKVFLDPGVHVKHVDKFKSDYKTQNVHPLYIDPSTLSGEDWANALATGGSSDALYVKKIFKILRNLPEDFDMRDIIRDIDASDLSESQKGLAKARLEILDEYLKKDDLVNNLVIGGVNIIDFRKAMYQPDDIFTIMTLIMSKLQNKKEFENEPFVFIMNEAHLYFKKGISKEFLDTIENLIRRKRHGANWLLLDTHLPVDVDPKVIELSDIKVLHFTDKTVDSPVLKRILEGKDDRLYKLHTGEAIICANQSSLGLSIPIHVNIRPRVSKHGGATKTATREK